MYLASVMLTLLLKQSGVGSRRTTVSSVVTESIYIFFFSLMVLFVYNLSNFQTILSIHAVDTRNKALLSRSVTGLVRFWRVVFYAGIEILNSLPSSILNLRDHKFHFKVILRKYLITHSF